MFKVNADIALIFVTHWTVLHKKRACLISHNWSYGLISMLVSCIGLFTNFKILYSIFSNSAFITHWKGRISCRNLDHSCITYTCTQKNIVWIHINIYMCLTRLHLVKIQKWNMNLNNIQSLNMKFTFKVHFKSWILSFCCWVQLSTTCE